MKTLLTAAHLLAFVLWPSFGQERGLDFLSDVVELRDLSLKITEDQLKAHIEKHRLYSERFDIKEVVVYWVLTTEGENVHVNFSAGKCCGIQRMERIPKQLIESSIESSDYEAWIERRKAKPASSATMDSPTSDGAHPSIRSSLPEPPADAAMGEERDNVQIGLWTEKSTYDKDELRNVWIIARKKGPSKTSIGVGGNLHTQSFIYIYSGSDEFQRIPEYGGIDGSEDVVGFAGGISDRLRDLPRGVYRLIWRTDRFESNTIEVKLN